eukprot:Gb_15474 [translate_table: standard]
MLRSEDNITFYFSTRLEFFCLNVVAKYEALIVGLQKALELKMTSLCAYTNNDLIVLHIKGVVQVGNPLEYQYYEMVRSLISRLDYFDISYISSSQNIEASSLALSASLFEPDPTVIINAYPIKICYEPVISNEHLLQVYDEDACCFSEEKPKDSKTRSYEKSQGLRILGSVSATNDISQHLKPIDESRIQNVVESVSLNDRPGDNTHHEINFALAEQYYAHESCLMSRKHSKQT